MAAWVDTEEGVGDGFRGVNVMKVDCLLLLLTQQF